MKDLTSVELSNIYGGGIKERIRDWVWGTLVDYILGDFDDLKEGYNDGLK